MIWLDFNSNLHPQFEIVFEDGCFGKAYVLVPAVRLRRIVIAYRLRQLGSADSLLWAVSLRQKQHSVVFDLLQLCHG